MPSTSTWKTVYTNLEQVTQVSISDRVGAETHRWVQQRAFTLPKIAIEIIELCTYGR